LTFLAVIGADIGLSITTAIATAIVIVAAVYAVVERVFDLFGWSRSSKILRQENADLARYNAELVHQNKNLVNKVGEHTATIFEQGIQIAELDDKLREVKRNDQAAVLNTMAEHEANVLLRHVENSKRTDEMLSVLGEIRDVLATNGGH